ncbi:MAG: guanylate kinase [Marinilabiliales bacterium]|nr:guanylate kinase [Marinilabiliales bacterium]
MTKGKIIIFSAPSGAGKTTIVRHLLAAHPDFAFSVSATSRKPRNCEKEGVDYYFLTTEAFEEKIRKEEFLEWQEVYPGSYYGSLKSEVDRITQEGKNLLFDVDVVGGSNIKKFYGDRALAFFVQPPSLEELERRLMSRSTDAPEAIRRRMEKAEQEMAYAPLFDVILVNDSLEHALEVAEQKIIEFLNL